MAGRWPDRPDTEKTEENQAKGGHREGGNYHSTENNGEDDFGMIDVQTAVD